MEILFVLFGIITIILVGIIIFLRKSNNASLAVSKYQADESKEDHEIMIPLVELPVDTKIDDSKLVEITDKMVISRVTNIVPNMLPMLTSAENVSKFNKVANLVKEGSLFQAILPQGGKLVDSKSMPGAVRGVARVNNKLNGDVNLVKVTPNVSNADVVASAASSVFGVASLVVGQYYMTQIYSGIGVISDSISKIVDFQNNEYKSKIMAMAIKVKQIAYFKTEILENDELRKNELINLQNLENTCIQLLQQANLTINDITKNSNIDYDKYEEQVKELFKWSQFQQVLVEVLYRIGELKYALSLGLISRDQCFSLYNECSKQVENIRIELNEWHTNQAASLDIDIKAHRRKRQAWDAIKFKIPGMINDNLNYRTIDEKTVEMIFNQTNGVAIEYEANYDNNLYQDDVKLIVKDGKLFYFPGD